MSEEQPESVPQAVAVGPVPEATNGREDGREDGQTTSGVLVAVERLADGSTSVSVHPVGDVRQTEVETVLGLALRHVREKLGLRAG